MSKEKKNDPYDSFAWLIYKEVEKFIFENEETYNAQIQEKSTPEERMINNEMF